MNLQIKGDGLMNPIKVGLLAIGLTFVAFGHSACTKQEQSGTVTPAGAQSQSDGKIPRSKAEQIALGKFPGSYLIGTELEQEEGVWIYAVSGRSEEMVYEVEINAFTGEVIQTKDKTVKFQAKVAEGDAVLDTVMIADRDAAEQAALSAYPGTVREWKAKADSTGRLAFSFKIQTADSGFKKILVAAGTNEIIRVK
jgi:uncharacterized membrane protein YkoI